MKKYFLLFGALISVGLQAQIQQNINKPSGTVSNAISEIDSIRFNTGSAEMQVVLVGGNTVVHPLGDIDNVTFNTLSGPGSHTCGAPEVHNTALTYGSMTDQQGNVYKTIVIGTQEWMAENLKTSIYRNGDAITNVTNYIQWNGLSTGAWCYFDNEDQYECPYGKLYNWYAVTDARNICPTGWHVPSDTEWSLLINHLDPDANGGSNFSNTAGGKMKSAGTPYWIPPNQNASNESGFSGTPSSFRYDAGDFGLVGYFAFWWSATDQNLSNAYNRYLDFANGSANRSLYNKAHGFAARCVRD